MLSGAVTDFLSTAVFRAVRTAINVAILFDSVADDATLAVRTNRRERLNGALERIKREMASADNDFEGFVVGVSASVASAHASPSLFDFETLGSPSLKSAIHFHHLKTFRCKAHRGLRSEVTGL